MQEGKLRVYRPKQTHVLRDYRLSVDGEERGSVHGGEFFIVMLPPGKHVVQAHIDWCSSPPLEVRIEPGSTCDLEVGGAQKLFAWLSWLTHPDEYLYLRPGLCRDTTDG